jgi:hypothetical protein
MVNVTGRPLLAAQGGRQSGLNPSDLGVPCEVVAAHLIKF